MISFSFLLTGFSLGLAGSLHCVGMCGPIALSLPLRSFSPASRPVAIALYHSGRLISYTTIGVVTGIIGQQLLFAGYQQVFSIIAGVLLLLYLWILTRGGMRGRRSFVFGKVQNFVVHHMQRPSYRNILFTGIGNGLLPCGMVYLAIAVAATSGNASAAGSFLLCFGIGTVPMMGMVSAAGLFAGPAIRNKFRKISPYITAVIGILLILRGLNMNIPYLSPLLNPSGSKAVISCHS